VRDFDRHKQVKGPKRHVLVDTLGLIITSRVEPVGTSGQRAGTRLVGGLRSFFPAIRTVMADTRHQNSKIVRAFRQLEGWQLVIAERDQRTFQIKWRSNATSKPCVSLSVRTNRRSDELT
jgi:transposase